MPGISRNFLRIRVAPSSPCNPASTPVTARPYPQRKMPAEGRASCVEPPSIAAGVGIWIGSPGWIRTTECLSQSQVPYRLATGLCKANRASCRGLHCKRSRQSRATFASSALRLTSAHPCAECSSQLSLALRELRRATSLVQTDFLALHFTRVAGHEAGLAKRRLQGFVVLDQRAGDAEADRAGLAGDAAAFHVDADVELVGHLGEFQRLAHDHARSFAAEEIIQ